MKTIWDAVNELGGEWKFKSEYICAASSKNKLYKEDVIRESHENTSNDCHYHICSKVEFNALVAEMSLGLGVNPINEGYYHKYLAADKQELEPAPVIDWDSAPEGATHYWEKSQSFYKFSSFEEEFVFCTGSWELCSDIACFGTEGLIPRPVTKPVYTQEMYDNGELPSVGMSFLCGQEMEDDVRIAEFGGEEVIVVGINKKGDRDIITFYHTSLGFGCGIFFSSWVNPITPKLELINGDAYQYNCDNSTYNGIYDEFKKSMYSVHSITCIEHCTNIKPLKVSD